MEEPTSRATERRERGWRYKCTSCGCSWSEPGDDAAEPTDPLATERREQGAPAKEEPSTEDGRRPRTLETLELIAVLLITSAYPILSHLLSEPDNQPIKPGQLTAEIPWLTGLTFIVWMLLRRGQGSLTPLPLSCSATEWVREVLMGLILFLAWWVLDARLAGLLREAGVHDTPSRWASFFREPGVAAVFSLSSFFSATYEEVVFRAYLISRLGLLLGKRRAWSVLVAAALFALVHGYAPRATLTVFAGGVVCGSVYLSSRSLPRLIVAHWVYDLAVMSHYLHAR